MPFVKVWIHFDGIRPQLFQHIRENGAAKGIYIDLIGGYVDHLHCLVSLGTDQTIEKIMQLIKGESSFWINKNRLCRGRFEWQDEYFAASVSETLVVSVRR
jgi:REP element-mobilizing transposase RayT